MWHRVLHTARRVTGHQVTGHLDRTTEPPATSHAARLRTGYGAQEPAYGAPAYYGSAGPVHAAPPVYVEREHAYPSAYAAEYVQRPPAAIPYNGGGRCIVNLGYGRWGYCN